MSNLLTNLKTINSLPFLGVNVDNSKEELELSFYRKQTHPGLYNKWSSLAPTKYKINLIRSLVNRAIKICNNRQLLFLECNKIPKMLQKDGYPIKTIWNAICKDINRNRNPDAELHRNQQQSTKHCVFFKYIAVYWSCFYVNWKRNSWMFMCVWCQIEKVSS